MTLTTAATEREKEKEVNDDIGERKSRRERRQMKNKKENGILGLNLEKADSAQEALFKRDTKGSINKQKAEWKRDQRQKDK